MDCASPQMMMGREDTVLIQVPIRDPSRLKEAEEHISLAPFNVHSDQPAISANPTQPSSLR